MFALNQTIGKMLVDQRHTALCIQTVLLPDLAKVSSDIYRPERLLRSC